MIDDNEFQCLAYFNINYVISTYCIVLIGLNSAINGISLRSPCYSAYSRPFGDRAYSHFKGKSRVTHREYPVSKLSLRNVEVKI